MASCADDTPRVPRDVSSRSAVILIPGYYGTRLTSIADHELMWLSVSQAFGNGAPLTLPLNDLGLHGPSLRPDGVLTEVPIVPFLYRIDAYDSMLRTLREAGLHVVELDYDWRGDLMESVRRLHDMVMSLRSGGRDHIALVTHSMGGLIACYYLRYGIQDLQTATETWEGTRRIATVVLAGVPFGGSMSVFRNMTYGIPIGLNKTLLNHEAVASFPASYYILPHSRFDLMLTPSTTPQQGLIGDARNWAHYQWGLLRDKDDYPSDLAHKRFGYISRWLQDTRRFHDLLDGRSAPRHGVLGSLMWLAGTGTPTLARAHLNEDATKAASIRFDDEAGSSSARDQGTSVFDDGDGTVTQDASALPDGFAAGFRLTRKRYEAEHIELMNRRDIRQDILGFVLGELASSPAPAP